MPKFGKGWVSNMRAYMQIRKDEHWISVPLEHMLLSQSRLLARTAHFDITTDGHVDLLPAMQREH